jgi:GTP-binding protein
MFVDEADIRVVSGKGGRGAVSFRREKFVPRGGPDGGDGGQGGSVFLVADAHRNTLLHFQYHPEHRAPNGRPGEGGRRTGSSGSHLRVPVPVGTTVFERSADDPATLVPIADLAEPGQQVLVARGGRGGLGNAHFATSTNRAPRKAQPGEPGEDRRLHLQLKLLADVGLVGFPNAGKSTLIARISAARPKIADYPFTTLTPNLGVVALSDDRTFVVADVPGLIEGAHAGHGLGHQFLRHVERTKVLLHLVDVSSLSGRDPVEDFDILRRELKLYNPAMLAKSQIVVASKIDAVDDPGRVEQLGAHAALLGLPFHAISAVTGEGVAALLEAAWLPVAEGRAAEAAAVDVAVEETDREEAAGAADYNPALVPPLRGRRH